MNWKTVFLAFAIGLLGGSNSPLQAAPIFSQVHSVANYPRSVRARTPRGSKSFSLRTAKIGINHSDVLMHYYATPARYAKGKNIPGAEFLDLFSRAKVKRRGQNIVQWKRTNSIKLAVNLASWIDPGDTGRFRDTIILWLKPETQQHPLILLTRGKLFENILTEGNALLLTFDATSHGIKGKAALQEFSAGHGLSYSSSVAFNTTDQRGFLVIVDEGSSYDSGTVTRRQTSFSWDGDRFVESK